MGFDLSTFVLTQQVAPLEVLMTAGISFPWTRRSGFGPRCPSTSALSGSDRLPILGASLPPCSGLSDVITLTLFIQSRIQLTNNQDGYAPP